MSIAPLYGAALMTGPALMITGPRTVEPMIVGPTWLFTCPIAGPMNDRTALQLVAEVPPAPPAVEGRYDAQPETLDGPFS
jgi:hypothetical protein